MGEESQNGGNATPTKELAAAAHEVEEEEPMVGPGSAPRRKRKRPLHSEHSLPSAKRPLFTRLMNSSFSLGFFTIFRKFIFQQDNKDTNSSSLSPTSPPSSSLSPTSPSSSRIWKHDVFPSFHGKDVRKTILSHILEAFRGKGIDTFIDNNIERSKSIGPELKKAIRGSKIAIIMLSRNYASSSWCLDELAEIMKCREEFGQIVMTIFYEVDPTDVKKQIGDFGKAFRKTCKGQTKEHIERWRKSLEDVAQIAGEHSWDNEAAMIKKIATDVSNKLFNSTPSRDFDDFVGMGAHMKRMEPLLRLDSNEVRMIGIWGLPGIGKTSIVRFLFNQFSSRFHFSAIMDNVKACYPTPCLDEYSAKLQLQKQMLVKIINQEDITVSHLGVAQERLKDKKVLLALDDVDRVELLDALAKETQWFGPGSRIIITTEDERVLKAHRIKHIYKVNFPSSEEAFQIFCMNAFGQKLPDDGFYKLAMKVTYLAGELPLGLKILGSYMRGMSKQEWEKTIPSLQTYLDGEVKSIIKFSYDALHDEHKELFLYIAWLFKSKPRHRVEEILAKKFSNVRHGLDVLAEKSLISIDRYGNIEMHTLLQNFGRETYRKHGKLLVGERDKCELLSEDTIDGRRFIGIKINYWLHKVSLVEEFIIEKAIERMSDFQFISIYGDIANSERLHSLLYYSQNIRSLHWEHFENICLPSTFNSEFLVELVMPFSKLQKLWEGTKPLGNLKWMDLTYSTNLRELPDLSTATNLQELFLFDCSSLVELPTSIGKLTSLQILDLSECSSLEKLPSSIENATNLQRLDLSNCSNLEELPSIGNATKLEELNLSNCSSLVKLPSSINATNLQKLSLINCSCVVKLPAINNATNLKILELENCSSLLELPPSIGTATNLEILNFSGCSSLVKLPSSIGDITNLRRFNLSNCSSLVELPSSIGNLQHLKALRMCGCSKLEALPTNINLESLEILDLNNCSQLKSFPEISTNIKDLRLIGTSIKEVPLSIMSWSRFSYFKMSYFESLKQFPHALDIITDLHLNEEDIQVAPWVKGMSSLRKLRLYNCNKMVSLPQFSDSLSYIKADNCKSLERLDCSFNNPDIRLRFTNCFKLNQEARDLIMHTSSDEFAILPGTQVPACFNYRATAGGPLTIKLNESSLPTSLRFKACIVMDKEETGDDKTGMWVEIDIMDKHNDLPVLCTSNIHYISPVLTEHIYTFEVEAREVTSTEIVFEFKTGDNKWKIGECGLYQILEAPSC